LREIISYFLKLGCLGFGGPIATMAMMESELVSQRKWIEPERFARAYALVKVLPGAAAIQMAIYIGQARRGRLGGLTAGLCFILPAFFLVLGISIAYTHFHDVPKANKLFSGMQVAALVVILESVFRMSKPYRRKVRSILIALTSAFFIFYKPSIEPLVILGFGLIGASNIFANGPRNAAAFFALPAFFQNGILQGSFFKNNFLQDFLQSPLAKVTLVCLKAGALVFGTGLAIIPMLEHDVVGHYHWLTHAEFLDGLAIGQVTPGPVVITATFIGYKVAGFAGAVFATLAIILPGFINILFIIPPFEKRISASHQLKDFTHWAIPAVIGGIFGTTIRLGFLVVNTVSLGLLLAATIIVVYKIKPPVWMVIPLVGLTYLFL
jgi:chromate transporter